MALGIANQFQCCRSKKRHSQTNLRLRSRTGRSAWERLTMKVLKLWLSTVKATFSSIGSLAIFALIYLLLLATFFKFIWTREATVWQVTVTYSFMVLIPAEFFIFQAAIIDRVRDGKFRWGAILIDAIKF